MKSIILAAGQGTRLRPYTDDRPKCMVPFRGRPLLYWQLDVLREAGLSDITVVGGYRADALNIPGIDITINSRFDCTNMVTTLFCAREKMKPGEDLLISYGDIIFERKVLQAVLDCDAPVCVAADRAWRHFWEMRMDNPLSDAETFKMDIMGNILELGKKARSYDEIEAQYVGLIKVRGDHIKDFIAIYDHMDRDAIYDGKNFDNMYMTSYLQHLIDSGWKVSSCLVDNGWLEVDTTDDLETYDRFEREGRLDEFYRFVRIKE